MAAIGRRRVLGGHGVLTAVNRHQPPLAQAQAVAVRIAKNAVQLVGLRRKGIGKRKKIEGDIGVQGRKLLYAGQQRRKRQIAAQGDAALQTVAFNILGGAVNAAERRGDLAVKAPPLGGELNAFAAFFKQLYAQFVFQTANGLAEGGLRNV